MSLSGWSIKHKSKGGQLTRTEYEAADSHDVDLASLGDTGTQGGTGDTGVQGDTGTASTVAGDTGSQGDTGASGGDTGTQGDTGTSAGHAILDGSVHTDSVADAVTKGSIVYGNATPKWDELVIGTNNHYLKVATDVPAWKALDISDDTTPTLGGPLNANGEDINNLGVIFLTEQAAAQADVAGKGQFWVKTATPNEAWFTGDAGTDVRLGIKSAVRVLAGAGVNADVKASAHLVSGGSSDEDDFNALVDELT